jgi:hypothetical protein
MDRRSEIERLAYELYEKSGCAHGHAEEHWLQAELVITLRCADPVPMKIAKEKKIVAVKAVASNGSPKKGKAMTKGKTNGKASSKGRSSQKKATL